MPVVIRPANHPPRRWASSRDAVKSTEGLLARSCRREYDQCERIIQSSFSCSDIESPSMFSTNNNIYASQNGFVEAVKAAYCQHHHLVIRPEDVWFAIITQFSFYVHGNAEKLRSHFVAHKGQKELTVLESGTIDSVDFGDLARRMTDMMSNNMIDPELKDWIMPDFSTTTITDQVTAAVLMMGSMQKYFSYKFGLTCGIPSVTLLGTQADWEKLRGRLGRLREFGEESVKFATLLVPILDHFLQSFETPEDPKVLDFWGRIADEKNMGSGPTYLSGWVTAFCFWDADGKPLLGSGHGCVIDGVQYRMVDSSNVPNGFVGVPVKVNDNGTEIETRMVAGSVGIAASSSGDKLDTSRGHTHFLNISFPPMANQGERVKFSPQVDEGSTGLDTLRCVAGWWIYEVAKGRSTTS